MAKMGRKAKSDRPPMSQVNAAEQDMATKLGWTCFPDPARGIGWCRFRRGPVHVWRIKDGWRRARHVHNSIFVGERDWKTLQEALTEGSLP